MSKKKTNALWATLIPIFSAQQKSMPVIANMSGDLDERYRLLIYMTADKEIDFSVSVLAAMNAQAPVESNDGDDVLMNSPWNGPEIFTDYILGNVPVSSIKPEHMSAEEMQNEFLVSSNLYMKNLHNIIPNPDFELATEMKDYYGQLFTIADIDAFIEITGEKFYQLLRPDNYGFSTTLIFPNQALVDEDVPDDDEDEEEKKKKPNPFNPTTKAPWDPTNPYRDIPTPQSYPKEKSPYDYSHSGASAADYRKYKENMMKKGHEDDNWPGHDKYGDYNK